MSVEIPTHVEPDVERGATETHSASDEAIRRIVADAMERVRSMPKKERQPPLRTDNPEETIGAFADMPNFVEIIAEVISRRSERYGRER